MAFSQSAPDDTRGSGEDPEEECEPDQAELRREAEKIVVRVFPYRE